jgi:hypothetical protein
MNDGCFLIRKFLRHNTGLKNDRTTIFKTVQLPYQCAEENYLLSKK